MRIAGVDPGRYGALAFADLVDGELHYARVYDMPLATDALGDERPDAREIHGIVSRERPDFIVMEHVSARPRQCAKAGWAFAQGFGVLVAAIQMLDDTPRIHLVRPEAWKEAMGLTLSAKATTTQKKAASLTMARAIFPSLAAKDLKRAKDDGRAEALLLLEYFRVDLAHRPEIEVL